MYRFTLPLIVLALLIEMVRGHAADLPVPKPRVRVTLPPIVVIGRTPMPKARPKIVEQSQRPAGTP